MSYKVCPGIVNGRAEDLPVCKKLAKIAITLLLVAPWVAMISITKHAGIDNPYVLLLFSELIPSHLFAMTIFFLADFVNGKLGLLKM